MVIWELISGQIFCFPEEYVAHGSDVKCLALGQSSGRLMVTGGEDTKVNVWSLDKPNCLLVSFQEHNNA